MKKALLLISLLTMIANAEYSLGVSKLYTQTENQILKQCYKWDTNQKKFEGCRKRVEKMVKKKLKGKK